MIRFAAIGSASASMPPTRIEPASGRSEPGDHPQRRGLAGAVGADQGVKLAGAHGQIESVDRGAVEALDEAVNFKGERRYGDHSERTVILRCEGSEPRICGEALGKSRLIERGFGPVNPVPRISRRKVKA